MSYKSSGFGNYSSECASLSNPTKLDELLKKTIEANHNK